MRESPHDPRAPELQEHAMPDIRHFKPDPLKGYDVAPRGRIRQDVVDQYHREAGR